MKGLFINSHDNEEIYVYKWDKVENPIGVVQIFHGMAEHAARYAEFAYYLNEKGFIVVADDHRGHGKTAGHVDNIGFIGDNGFHHIVEDERFITNRIKEEYPNLPVFIFSHSFGSFVGQEYLNRYSDEIAGMILCGSAKQSGLLIRAGRGLATLRYKFGDEKKRDYLLDKLIFGNCNKKEKEHTSKFAWLSADKEEVQKYEQDKYCGEVFTTNFFYHLFEGFKDLYKKEYASNIKKETPVFVIAGEMDPIGNYGKSVRALHDYYKEIGMEDVSLTLYPEGRHEILNEVNKLDVYEDVYTWLLGRVKK